MRAIVFRTPGGLEHLEIAELPDPGEPKPGEIKVRLQATSLNFHDFAVATGAMKVSDGRILMSDGCGQVVAIGAGVEAFNIGDSVIATFYSNWEDGEPQNRWPSVHGDTIDGFGREYAVAPASSFTLAPKGMSPVEAATLSCAGLTAWRALVPSGNLKAGETVLVLGSGGVSIFAIQFAKAMGARVIATTSADAKVERLKALGADEVINYRQFPKWGAVVREVVPGGVDHVIEIGGATTLPQSIVAARNGGHIALIGLLTGSEGPIPTTLMMTKQIRLIGVTVGSRRHQQEMVRAVETIGLRPVIDRSFAMEQIGDAFRYQSEGAHFGKIGLTIP